MTTLASLNINGLASAWEARLNDYIRESGADVFCVQETRTDRNLWRYFVSGYSEYFCPSSTPGYAGVGLYTKRQPLSLIQGIGVPARADEGRALTMETRDFYLVNVYSPASGADLEHLGNKVSWIADLTRFVTHLEKKKPVVICGDMNVAGGIKDQPSDQFRTPQAGNTREELKAFNTLIDAGYYDVWRMAHGNERGVSWTPYLMKDRGRFDAGWRLDYFLVSKKLIDHVTACDILPENDISDHRCVRLRMR